MWSGDVFAYGSHPWHVRWETRWAVMGAGVLLWCCGGGSVGAEDRRDAFGISFFPYCGEEQISMLEVGVLVGVWFWDAGIGTVQVGWAHCTGTAAS